MRKKRKYQIGGKNPWEYNPNLPEKNIYDNGQFQTIDPSQYAGLPQTNFSAQAAVPQQRQGIDLSNLWDNVDYAAQGLTGILNGFQSRKAKRQENMQYLQSIQPGLQQNYGGAGYNNTAAYFQNGGGTITYPIQALSSIPQWIQNNGDYDVVTRQNGGTISYPNMVDPGIPRWILNNGSYSIPARQNGGTISYPNMEDPGNPRWITNDGSYLLPKYQAGGRLVDQVPDGYNFSSQQDNRKYYIKNSTQPIDPAISGGKPGANYQQFLINKLKSGVSPQQLANNRYISPEEAGSYQQYYKPMSDTVYTQTNPVPQPAQAFQGQPIYNVGNKHILGFSRYNSRQASSQTDAGGKNTVFEPVDFMYSTEDGKPDFSKGQYKIPYDIWSNQITKGVNSFNPTYDLSKYKVQMKTGGLTAQKAAEILHDGTVHGKPITDKQRRYFGFVSNGGKQNGGEVDESNLYKNGGVYEHGGELNEIHENDHDADDYKNGGVNFKNKKAYSKWLAYGHMHKVFHGKEKVSIAGHPHKVDHSKQNGGYSVGQELELSPEKISELRKQGYDFEIL